jgi:hypothetical protein
VPKSMSKSGIGDIMECMKADKGQFDQVLRRMLEKPPQKTSSIRAEKAPKKAPSQGQK